MTAAWPTAKIAYQPLNDGYGHDFSEPRKRTPFEQGEARQRRVVRSAKTLIHIAWAFTPAGYQIFRAFLSWSIADGADPFTMPVLTGSPAAYQNLTVNFVKGSIEPKRDRGEWIVTAQLETDELPVMTSGALDALIGAAGATPVWPAALPQAPQNNDMAVQLPDGLVRSDFEQGLIEQRRVFSAAPALYTQSWILSDAEYDLFRAWRKYRIKGGDAWFACPIFRDLAYVNLWVRIVAGSLSARRDGADWRLTAQLEMADLPRAAASVLT